MPTPKTTTRKDGTKVVDPDFSLKEKLGGANMAALLSEEKVQRAAAVVDEEKASFGADGLATTKGLRRMFDTLRQQVGTGEDSSGGFVEMLDTTLNLKSQAGIYGYALATEIARSLYGFCSGDSWKSPLGLRIIEVHIDALHRVFAEDIKGDGGKMGKEVLAGLNQLTT